LCDILRAALARYEFQQTEEYRAFERCLRHARWLLRLGFVTHKDSLDVFVSVSVRLNSLEELLCQVDETKPCDRYTLGAELGNLTDGRQKRWTLTTQGDLQHVATSIMDTFVINALPYFERYSAIDNAFEVLSRDDRTAWLHCPVHDERAKRAVTAAFLIGDIRQFHHVARVKCDFLRGRADSNLVSFLRVRDALAHRLGEAIR
jgi:hypothetical protein